MNNNIRVTIGPSIPDELSTSNNEIVQIVNNSMAKIRPGLTNKLEIEIIFATREEIKKLNLKHRNVDVATDVLSFPQEQIEESLVNILGSIVICSSVVLEKNEEIPDVVKHGLLHLLGYDHEKNENNWKEAAKKINCNL